MIHRRLPGAAAAGLPARAASRARRRPEPGTASRVRSPTTCVSRAPRPCRRESSCSLKGIPQTRRGRKPRRRAVARRSRFRRHRAACHARSIRTCRGVAPRSPGRPVRRAASAARPAFRLGVPALDRFPLPLWSQLVSRRMRSMTPGQLDYADASGCIELRSPTMCRPPAAPGSSPISGRRCGRSAAAVITRCCSIRAIASGSKTPYPRRLQRWAGRRSDRPCRVDSQGSRSPRRCGRRRTPGCPRHAINQFPLGADEPDAPSRLLKWATRAGT